MEGGAWWATVHGVAKSRTRLSEFTSLHFCFIDYAKAFDCVDHNKLWKILKEMGMTEHVTCLMRNLYAGQQQQLELNMEQQTGSKSGKEYVKAVYYHPAHLTYMQSK